MKKEQKELINKHSRFKNKIKMEIKQIKNLIMKNKNQVKYQKIVINNKYKNQIQALTHYGPLQNILKNGKKLCF